MLCWITVFSQTFCAMFREYSFHVPLMNHSAQIKTVLWDNVLPKGYSKSYSCLCRRKVWVTYRQLRARRALMLFSDVPFRTRRALYHHRLDTVISPFSFSKEHLSTALTPFSLSTDNISVLCIFFVCSYFSYCCTFQSIALQPCIYTGCTKKSGMFDFPMIFENIWSFFSSEITLSSEKKDTKIIWSGVVVLIL